MLVILDRTRELARYNISIAALSETRFADKGQLTETGGGYTFFWSGRSSEERREAGVGFAVKSNLVKELVSIPKGINDRLMTMQIPLSKQATATSISAYAPTMTNPEEVKDKFYEELDSLITTVRTEKLIVLGDFNARVGKDHQAWHRNIGKHGVGNCNSNGHLLLRLCATHDLVITNTLFRLPTRKKTSWMHPRSKHWHLIDYVIVRARDRQDVKVTKAMCGADCWTDHRLIVSKMKLHLQSKRRPQGQRVQKKLNISSLKNAQKKQEFQAHLHTALSGRKQNQSNIEDEWVSFRDTTHQAALECLGPASRNHQDWFDENDADIQMLLNEKHRLLRILQNDPSNKRKKAAFTTIRSTVQSKLRQMQDSWYSRKADEIQAYADKHETKRFYDALKAVYGPRFSGSSPLLSADGGTLLTEKKLILERWAEHFDSVLNRPAQINDEAIARLPQVPINHQLDVFPTEEEVHKAIKQMSTGKAPGSDAIPSEIYKEGGPIVVTKLTNLYKFMWRKEQLPQEFRDATIVHIYKRKGNRQSCDSHRGISLLSIAGKILARILLNRLLEHLEESTLLPESQCGFRSGRGTSDMIFAARQLQEKCIEQHRDLYTTFIDLTKAFDTVCREGLWKIMEKYGCPSKFTTIVRQFHDGMTARVLDDGEPSEAFPVTNGVKQGCVLAPTLFSMIFSAMLSDASSDPTHWVDLKYRFDGKLFNLRRLQASTKVKETSISSLLFADDCALNSNNEEGMQLQMDKFSTACDKFGLTISTKKTEVMYQPAPGKQYHVPQITVSGQTLQAADTFQYLGSTLSRNATIDAEIDNRIAKASSVFGRLAKNVWNRRGLRTKTKLKVYQAAVLTTLLYGCETWTAYRRHEQQLNRFHLKCLRNLLRIRWQDKIPDTEVLLQAEIPSVVTLLHKAQLRWTGHVVRMHDNRIPKQLLYGELSSGKRKVGGQKKRFKDNVKVSLKNFKINTDTWESLAVERSSWRSALASGALTAEQQRQQHAEQKRQLRKSRSQNRNLVAFTHTCPTCGRGFHAQIGLTSHLRTHRGHPT